MMVERGEALAAKRLGDFSHGSISVVRKQSPSQSTRKPRRLEQGGRSAFGTGTGTLAHYGHS